MYKSITKENVRYHRNSTMKYLDLGREHKRKKELYNLTLRYNNK